MEVQPGQKLCSAPEGRPWLQVCVLEEACLPLPELSTGSQPDFQPPAASPHSRGAGAGPEKWRPVQ